MQTTSPTLGTISWGRRLMPAAAALGLLLVLGFAQPALAQTTPPLTLSNNYFVTGDYVVAGVGLRGTGNTTTNLATGMINMPDPNSVPSTGVPAGADIVAALLYWETVESNIPGAITGKHGFFGHVNSDGSVS